jgi:hypothetical protein
MDIKVIGGTLITQLVFSYSPWIPISNLQNICGTCGRQNGTEALVQIVLQFVSPQQAFTFEVSLFLNQSCCSFFTNNAGLSVLSVHSDTLILHF